MNGKLGTASVVIYFRNHTDPAFPEGWEILAPYSDFPTAPGWSRHEADDLHQIDALERRLNDQELRRAERENAHEQAYMEPLRQKVRDQLMAKLLSDSTSEYDKDYIREWMKLRSEKRARHSDAFTHRSLYLHQRHFDTARSRDANVERVDLDRIG